MKKVRSSDLQKYVNRIYSENVLEDGELSEYMNNVVVNVNSFCICILDYNFGTENDKLLENFANEIEEVSLKNLKCVSIRRIEGEEYKIEIYISISNEYEIVID